MTEDEERQFKLKKLQGNPDGKTTVIITSIEPFVEALDNKIDELKETLGLGTKLNNIDDLLSELEDIGSLKEPIVELREAVKATPEIPGFIKIENLDTFVQAIKDIKVETPEVHIEAVDYTNVIKRVITLLGKIVESVNKSKYQPGQNADDFIPYRRVVKAGNTLVFDDKPTPPASSGGGGGRATGNTLYVDIYKTMARKITVSGADTYIAYAPPSSLQAQAVWQVKKINVTGSDTTVTWADGNSNYDNAATDLTTLTYV